MLWIIGQILWIALTAVVILVDARLAKTKEPDPENPDLRDRSMGPFLAAMFIFGGLVIPFYLWYSRRSTNAVLVGVGLALACAVIVGACATALRSAGVA